MGTTDKEQQKVQSAAILCQSASLANIRADGTGRVPASKGGVYREEAQPPVHQGVRMAFFFDGTGNNLEADIGNNEHSNVARLYQLHPRDDSARNIFRYYIPGIGTRFKEIGDPGGLTQGLAFGARGEDRLKWAMTQLEKRVSQSHGHKLHLALFGFSRGATLARAFALRIANRCQRRGDGVWLFTHQGRKHPIRLYFMGLFDTVASVGVSMGANNEEIIDLTMGTMGLVNVLRHRAACGSGLYNIAFASGGAPGADPASGAANGHMAWADDLRIPEMVEDCLHMVAAHEIRNSFPLDSVLQGSRYPRNCREFLYPGAHSDVGGGYRLGEGARSPLPGSLLSLVPLRAMRAEAIRAGVPLMTVIPSELLKSDVAEDPASKAAFETLSRRFNHYMDVAGWGGKSLGDEVLSHMKLYYRWRFHKIARNRRGRAVNGRTPDQELLQMYEPVWEKERISLSQKMASLQKEARMHQMMAGNSRAVFENSPGRMSDPFRKIHETHLARAREKEDLYLTEKSLLDTLPTSDGSFVRNSNVYDDQLLLDASKLQQLVKMKGRDKLRPHYRALLEAHEAELKGQGLRDEELIAFFDTYVHDSLAGFAMDATLPSDPRVLYIGGDEKLRYAVNQAPKRGLPFSTPA